MREFLHTLIFNCPDCGLPLSVSIPREERNREAVDALTHRVECVACNRAYDLGGFLARSHTVRNRSLSNVQGANSERA